jgi:aminopeptidase N
MPPSSCKGRLVALGAFVLCACSPTADIVRAPPPAPAAEVVLALPAPLADGRLPGTARPLRYAVSLVVDPSKERFAGDVTIDIDVAAATSAVVMHGRELALVHAEAIVDSEHLPATGTSRAPAGAETRDELVLSFSRPLPKGRAQLRIAYSASFDAGGSGLFRVKEGSDVYAFTQLEPVDARRVLPCFDEPGYKTPFDVKITVPKGQLAISNAPEIGRTDTADGRQTTFTFETTQPLPTYLFALAAGPLEIREGPRTPVPIRLVTTRGRTKLGNLALENATVDLPLLAAYFDRPYPYAKLDLVAVPNLGVEAMENAGLVTFREDLLLVDAQSASVDARREVAEIMAHELSHQWLGNLVTMPWWDELWLNEGITTWSATKVTGALDDATIAKHRAMDVDALATTHPVRGNVVSPVEAEDAFDEITYDKGASVMSMLEAWLGEEAIKKGLRAHLAAHEHGTASSVELWKALGDAGGKDVASVAGPFVDTAGVPLLRADLVCEKGKPARVTLGRERFRVRAAKGAAEVEAPWKLPVCVAYEGAAPACATLEAPSTTLELPGERCPRWIYPNAGEHGYYRFALPSAQWASLVGSAKKLEPRLRTGLVANARALVQSGDLAIDGLVDLLAALKGERSPSVLAEMAGALADLRMALVDAGTRAGFSTFASSLFLPLGKELGWKARRGDGEEVRRARAVALEALGAVAEDAWTLGEAERCAGAYLDDPGSLEPDTTAMALRLAARRGDDKRLLDLRDAIRMAATPDERVMAARAIGHLGEASLLRRGLDLSLTGELRTHETTAAFLDAASSPETLPTALAWLKERWPELGPRLGVAGLSDLSTAVGRVCDARARDDAAAFFTVALREAGAGRRPLDQAIEQADACIALREREGARFEKRFGKK